MQQPSSFVGHPCLLKISSGEGVYIFFSDKPMKKLRWAKMRVLKLGAHVEIRDSKRLAGITLSIGRQRGV